jgi:hypothetical protein
MGALLDRWSRAKSEIKLYDGQLARITETAIFKRMASGQAAAIADEKAQVFRTQSKNIFTAIVENLDVNGMEPSGDTDDHKRPKKRSGMSKDSLARDSFDFIKENVTDSLFKQINANKAAARLAGKDYEVNISAHRTPVVDMSSWTEIVVDGKIPEFVQKTSNYLLNLDYNILLIKNNQITFSIDGSQYSLRFTGKTKLF